MATANFPMSLAPGLNMFIVYNTANGNASQVQINNDSTTTWLTSGQLTNGFTWGVPTRLAIAPGVHRTISISGQGVSIVQNPNGDPGDMMLSGVDWFEIGQ